MNQKPVRILLVEDDPDQIFLMRQGLEHMPPPGFQIDNADSLEAAFRILSQGRIDVVLLDLNIRDSKGLDTLARVYERFPRAPIVVLTGSYDEEKALDALYQGAQDYLLKGNVDFNLVVRSLRYAIGRKQVQEEARRAHERSERLLSSITAILIGVDSAGVVTHWNSVAERTFGIPARNAIGRAFSESGIRWTDSKTDGEIKTRLNQSQPSQLDDISFQYPDGKNGFLGLTVIPMKEQDEASAGFVLFGADITERKKTQEERAKLEEHIREVQKMESIGTLAGGIAHDFKNILGPILGYAEMLSRSLPAGTRECSRALEILKSAERARKLIDQILIFSRKGAEERTAVHLASVVREALTLLKEVMPSTIEIVTDVDREGGHILANPTQVHQVVMNLCINAGYAMKESGGRLSVRVKNVHVDSDFARLHAGLVAGAYVKLSVEDTGSGIDSQILPRVFDPFFTTKPVGEGSGMGLAVVHGIVTGHGGVIEVTSVPNQGTVFDVYFPVSSRSSDSKGSADLEISGGTEHILLVDDDVNQIHVMTDMLESLGYRVTKTTSSTEAVDLFRAQPDEFKIALVDQIMPKMTGMKLAVELLKIRPTLPIILCTGTYAAALKEATTLGIRKCVEKPVSLGTLARSIREALA